MAAKAAKKMPPKRRMTEMRDDMMDRKRGIPEKSGRDRRIDRKRRLPAD